jgi:hypothetical protein
VSVSVGEMTSTVDVVPETRGGAAAEPPRMSPTWDEVDRLRATADRLAQLAARTRAERFDD